MNAENKDGMTPLHIAMSLGCLHVAASLLQAGANPNSKDNVAFLFTERRLFAAHCYPLDYAVDADDTMAVQMLVNYGADPNIKNGSVPFINTAIEAKHNEIVKILVENRATVTGLAYPPLMAAVDAGYADVFKILRAHGASGTEIYKGTTVVQYAEKKKSPLVKLLKGSCA